MVSCQPTVRLYAVDIYIYKNEDEERRVTQVIWEKCYTALLSHVYSPSYIYQLDIVGYSYGGENTGKSVDGQKAGQEQYTIYYTQR